ncbi:M50 family metallopeptidase [Jeotgalibacillus proteolyticus]|uniref:M50 family metallopeptidase n=1 Tax=Jeotgalibacillus proteolyticus TaxID=2082395 RepID=UPI003CEC3CE2
MEQHSQKKSEQLLPKLAAKAGQLAGGAIVGVLIASYIIREDVAFSLNGVVYLLFIMVFSIILSVMIHETGHAIGGKLGGMEVMNLSYGPFVYAKVNGRKRFFFRLPALGYLGRAMMRFPEPIEERDMRKKLLRFIYAGPISNLVTGIPAIAAAYLIWPSGALLIFGVINLFFGLTNLANVETSAGAQSDGRMIAVLKGKEPGVEVILVSYQLLQEDPQAMGQWSRETIEKTVHVIEKYRDWPLASSLLSTIGPYFYTSNPERFLELTEGKVFHPRSKQGSILQDMKDVAAAAGLYFAGKLKDEENIEEKLQLISDREPVSRYLRDAYLAIARGQNKKAFAALDQVEAAIGEWHPLYLEGTALHQLTNEMRNRLSEKQN